MSWLDSLTSAQKTVLALSAGVLLIGFWLGTDGWGAGGKSGQQAEYTAPEFQGAKIMVHVVGAVQRPGVYELPSGARGVDAINAAGGFAASAVRDDVNLAEILDDGAQVRVEAAPAPQPAQVVAVPMAAPTPVAAEVASTPQAAPTPPAALRAPRPAAQTGVTQAAASSTPGVPSFMVGAQSQPPIRINVAGLQELQELPGIGEELAKNIVYYRAEHGPFRSFSDLDGVPGIGPATIDKIRTRAILN